MAMTAMRDDSAPFAWIRLVPIRVARAWQENGATVFAIDSFQWDVSTDGHVWLRLDLKNPRVTTETNE